MTEFMWGALTGAVTAPFAWVALKWCMSQLKKVTGQ
jgi:hypothetical protein